MPRRPGRRRAKSDPVRAAGGGTFYLTRTERGAPLFLYGWDHLQSAWGPDRAKAFRFPSALAAIDLAVLCGGPDGASRITIVED